MMIKRNEFSGYFSTLVQSFYHFRVCPVPDGVNNRFPNLKYNEGWIFADKCSVLNLYPRVDTC